MLRKQYGESGAHAQHRNGLDMLPFKEEFSLVHLNLSNI